MGSGFGRMDWTGRYDQNFIEDASGDVPPPPSFLEVPLEYWMDQLRPDLTPIQARFDPAWSPNRPKICVLEGPGGSRQVPGPSWGGPWASSRKLYDPLRKPNPSWGRFWAPLGGVLGSKLGSFSALFWLRFRSSFVTDFGTDLGAFWRPTWAPKPPQEVSKTASETSSNA